MSKHTALQVDKSVVKTLEKEVTNSNMSSILHGVMYVYDFWYDGEGNKTQYLKTIEKEGLNLVNMSSILNGAWGIAAEAFREIYNAFLDEQGNKKQHLKHFIQNIRCVVGRSSQYSSTLLAAASNYCCCVFGVPSFVALSVVCGSGGKLSMALSIVSMGHHYRNYRWRPLSAIFEVRYYRGSPIVKVL